MLAASGIAIMIVQSLLLTYLFAKVLHSTYFL